MCPVNIPLPTLLRGWREKSWREGLEPVMMRRGRGLGLWAWAAKRPAVYRFTTRVAITALRRLGKHGWIARLPLASGWTDSRDFPRPEGGSFMSRYRQGER